MRVEQRIGRLDRIGQKSDRISVWNLFAADTIDERIHDRLYMRLDLFKRALGTLRRCSENRSANSRWICCPEGCRMQSEMR